MISRFAHDARRATGAAADAVNGAVRQRATEKQADRQREAEEQAEGVRDRDDGDGGGSSCSSNSNCSRDSVQCLLNTLTHTQTHYSISDSIVAPETASRQ